MENLTQEWKSELINKLFPIKANDIDIEGAMQIKYENMPEKLYRYRPIKNKFLKELKNGNIWISSADNLNDPFECMYKIGSSAFLEIYAKAHGIAPSPEIKIETENICRSLLENDKSIESLKKSTYICCFSEFNDSKLMWSHYADGHKGFCIEYDFKNEQTEEELIYSLFPIIYREELFDLVPHLLRNDNPNPLIEIYLAMFKEISWSYEHEWRIIFPEHFEYGSGPKKGPVITAIYMGSNITESNKKKLIKIAKEKDIHIYQMEIDEYSLKAKLIEKGE
ncbi:hypothetical protein HNP93_001032 [Methanococcus maripaludis]|uniref:DUF2971 family protein n=1 Tax=Methanococcus maripaludis TaxID=39152 RepID=A0A7J9P545_METMI|nr:DUF2971 domain-containing protein [Methanococcus maripaludis]MBA2858331.1 hypothetical protein [Methanococcus maripaludis]